MQLKMVGIDHNLADLDNREAFSFTTNEIEEALIRVKKIEGITGTILISTCNRTELWLSCDKNDIDAGKILSELKEKDFEDVKTFFVYRQDKDAIWHLMTTACGINSKVFGEDQILTQIRDALEQARMLETTSSTLEKVFQNSISAAKKVKDSVRLTTQNSSVASSGIKELKSVYGSLQSKECLIIGNGKMAILIAEHLVENGANVTMTKRRRYLHHQSVDSHSPKGCKMISYEDRYDYIGSADIVISATLSPHNTITMEGLKGKKLKEPSIWLDLAVPRDIDREIAKEYNITIWDIDVMEEDISEETQKDLHFAKEIIGAYGDDMIRWLNFRKLVPKVNDVVKLTKKDAYFRAEKELKNLDLDSDKIKEIEKIIIGASGRAISKLLYGLKDGLSENILESTIDALYEIASKETLKR